MKISSLMVLSAMAGCASDAPITSDQTAAEYHRQNARIETIEEFERRKIECARAGGTLLVDRRSSGRMPPTTTELRRATCSR